MSTTAEGYNIKEHNWKKNSNSAGEKTYKHT